MAVDANTTSTSNSTKTFGLLSDTEINDLIHRLENIHDIQFVNEEKIRDIIINQHERKISSLIDLAKKALTSQDPNDSNNLFNFIVSKKDEDTISPTTTTAATTVTTTQQPQQQVGEADPASATTAMAEP